MTPRKAHHPYALLAPTALLLGTFFFYPLAFAAYRSLFSWDLLTPPRWVGLGNYRDLVASGDLIRTLGTTLGFSAAVVIGATSVGLALALALNRPGRLAAFARSAVFSAYVVSWVSVALLWLWVLDADAGLVNAALRRLGLPGPRWLSDPALAPWTLAAVTVWKVAGYAMVAFLAGLQDVPGALLEAAALDGASPWQRFWRVTWPLLRPTAAFVGTTSLIASFQVFDVVRVMTQGGPVRSTTVFVYAIYEQVFLNFRVGRASALVMVFFVVLLALTALQMRVWRART